MKKRTYKSVIVCVTLIAIWMIAPAQQPKPEFRLNPEASKVWANIDQSEAELRRQYDQLESQRIILLIGAGVPGDSRSCKTDEKGIVVCVKPETVKATSEKK
jgi:hypothetical protein